MHVKTVRLAQDYTKQNRHVCDRIRFLIDEFCCFIVVFFLHEEFASVTFDDDERHLVVAACLYPTVDSVP
jgi:hypothetical protein